MAINFSDGFAADARAGFHFIFANFLHFVNFTLPFISPILIASIAATYEKKMDGSFVTPVKEMITAKDLQQFLKEEEIKERQYLNDLKKVQQIVSDVLHYKCSPIKSRLDRLNLEDNAFLDSPLEVHRGLRNVFQYDHQHCGKTASQNGQLWRVWMEAWKAQAEARKYRTVIEKIKDKLKE